MITNQISIILFMFLFTIINLILFECASDGDNPHTSTGSANLEQLSSTEIPSDNKTTSSESDHIGKRSREDAKSSTSKGQRKKYKYRHNLPPIPPIVNPAIIGNLEILEAQLANSNKEFNWNLQNVSTKMATYLCNFAWLRQPTPMKVTDKMSPACTPLKIPNLSHPNGRDPKVLGYFSYLKEEEDTFFSADWLRCNCAYVTCEYGKDKVTVKNSKGFFFLFTADQLLYFVTTVLPEFEPDNVVKIIDMVHLPPPPQEQ